MANDKPFECTEPGCGMSFANEDHLSVHQAKHAMSLALTCGSTRPGGLLNFVADQTPTPTKFLRNCEEMGLFHELSKNPFDDAFKKAAEESKHLDLPEQSSPFPVASLDTDNLHDESISDSLNTPTPMLLDSLMRKMSGHHASKHLSVSSISCSKQSPLPGPDADTGSTVGCPVITITPSASADVEDPSNDADLYASVNINVCSSEVSTDACVANLSADVVVELENDVSFANSVTAAAAVADEASFSMEAQSLVPPEIDVSQPQLQQPVTIKPAAGQLVLIRSPTGQYIPARLIPTVVASEGVVGPAAMSSAVIGGSPTSAAMSSPSSFAAKQPIVLSPRTRSGTAPNIPVNSVVSASRACNDQTTTSSSCIASSTKERLKAAIKQNLQASQPVLSNNMRVITDAVDWVTSGNKFISLPLSPASDSQTSGSSSVTVESPPNGLIRISEQQIQFEDADTSTPKQLRLSSSDTDQDDRRTKFLLRNRAAAARCRMKKKAWMSNLEQRADEVQLSNCALQTEVLQLREEVMKLKAMLSAHTDCPVTRRQQTLVAASQSYILSTVALNTAESDEAIAMAALSSLSECGQRMTTTSETQLVRTDDGRSNSSTDNNRTVNCAMAIDLSLLHGGPG